MGYSASIDGSIVYSFELGRGLCDAGRLFVLLGLFLSGLSLWDADRDNGCCLEEDEIVAIVARVFLLRDGAGVVCGRWGNGNRGGNEEALNIKRAGMVGYKTKMGVDR